MGRVLYLECNSGISGDMTVGALLDLGADREVLEKALGSLKVGGYHLHFGRKETCGLDAFDFDVHLEGEGHEHGHGNEGEHGHGYEGEHEHGHRNESEHGHGYEGEHGHGYEGEHGHGYEGEHGHGYEGEHGHRNESEHGHGHEGEHGHGHEGEHGHGYEGEHGHGYEGERGHEDNCGHGYEGARDHGYEGIHGHGQEGDHSHGHEGDHSHGHEGEHGHGDESAHSYRYEEEHSHVHEGTHDHGHEGEHEFSHIHRNLNDINQIINNMEANDHVKKLAKKMFLIVAEAESKAHGLPLDQVHFHEVGAIDSIVDIISVAVCVDNLGVEDIVVSPLSEGRGHVHCQHGVLPVPVPATANIASAYGLELHLTDNNGEMVTPTGAAIAAALRTKTDLPDSCRLLKIGMGAGNRTFKQANVLRAMLLETRSGQKKGTDLWVMESNIDDCSGEALGLALELLLEAGAADVWYTPIYMKKNRPAYMMSVLYHEADQEKLEDIIIAHTTTIGIRHYPVTRTAISREVKQVNTAYGTAQIKVCSHKGKTYGYPEYESVRNICKEHGIAYQSAYDEIRRAWNEI